MRAAIITVSTSKAADPERDESGPILAELARAAGAEIVAREIVADDRQAIEAQLIRSADELDCDLALTTGGTGFAPSDVTPEATLAVVDRLAPGLPEAMRATTVNATKHAVLSRAAAGFRGKTLIVNFPGSPSGVRECFAAISDALPHAVALLRGEHTSHDD